MTISPEAMEWLSAHSGEYAKEIVAGISSMQETISIAISVVKAAPELNPCNYNHDDVCELNTAMIEVYTILSEDSPSVDLSNAHDEAA